MDNNMTILFSVLFYITVIGALNWGLQVYGLNLVEQVASLAGDSSKMVENGVYLVVAVAGLVAGVLYTMNLINNKDKSQ
jgi:uncharacterized membrane protein YuzA (DUF378 family)